MSNLRQLLVHASQYLVGRASLMLLGFLSFPVLTRILSVGQYGELSLVLKLCMFWTVLSKCGMQNAALRLFPEYSRTSAEEKCACSSTLVLSVAGIAGVLMLAGLALVHWPRVGATPAVVAFAPLLLLLAFVRSIQPTLSGLLRSERRTWLFNACELSGKAMGIIFAVSALLFLARDLRFYLSGLVCAEALVVAAVAFWFFRSGLLRFGAFRPSLGLAAIRFAAPLIAYELTSVILDSGDRILIGRYLGLTQLGLYSAAYSVATYAEEALMTPVNMALMPEYMRIWVENGPAATSRFLSQALDLFLMGCGVVALLVYVNAPDLLAILASRKFAAAGALLPILVVGLLVYAVHIFFNAPLIIHRRSLVLTAVTTACCIFNVILNIVLLPRMGIAGAAWATLASYLAMVAALAIISRRYLPMRIPWATLASACGLVASIQWLLKLGGFSSPWLNLAAKAPAALLLYGLGMVLLRPALRASLIKHITRIAPFSNALSAVEP